MSILILHGWGLSGQVYKNLALEFKKYDQTVYIPDLPGFGKEKVPERSYSLDDYVAFLLQYIKKNRLKSLIVIGHSFGGRVAIKLAADYPKLVERLILTGVPGILPVAKLKVYLFLILAKVGKFIFSLPFFSNFSNLAEKILYKLTGAFDYYQTQGMMRETFKKIVREDLRSYMQKIRCPTLLIWGREDKITPLWIGEKWRRRLKEQI